MDESRRADGLDYTMIPGCDRSFFRCSTWSATLSVDACEKRWREAKAAKGDRAVTLAACASCAIGAAHAGQPFTRRSSLFGTGICPRCHRGGAKMVGNRICVSEYNRQRELVLGANAKGTRPVKAAGTLSVRRTGVILDHGLPNQRAVIYQDVAANLQELAIQVLRTYPGPVAFCWPLPGWPAWCPPPPARRPGSSAAEMVPSKYL